MADRNQAGKVHRLKCVRPHTIQFPGWLLSLFVGLMASEAVAQEAELSVHDQVEVEEASPGDVGVSEVGLDRLLVLPDTWSAEPTTRQGNTSAIWRQRFAESDQAIAAAQAKIDEARQALDTLSGGGQSQWQMAPPGASANTEVAPLSIKHREQIRAGKLELEQAERDLRGLKIEADLAGVPQSWRKPVDPSLGAGGG